MDVVVALRIKGDGEGKQVVTGAKLLVTEEGKRERGLTISCETDIPIEQFLGPVLIEQLVLVMSGAKEQMWAATPADCMSREYLQGLRDGQHQGYETGKAETLTKAVQNG